MRKEIGKSDRVIKVIDGYTLRKITPYYRELNCDEDSFFYNIKTKENLGSRVYLWIIKEDDEGVPLPESEWRYDTTEDLVLKNPEGGEYEIR